MKVMLFEMKNMVLVIMKKNMKNMVMYLINIQYCCSHCSLAQKKRSKEKKKNVIYDNKQCTIKNIKKIWTKQSCI